MGGCTSVGTALVVQYRVPLQRPASGGRYHHAFIPPAVGQCCGRIPARDDAGEFDGITFHDLTSGINGDRDVHGIWSANEGQVINIINSKNYVDIAFCYTDYSQ